MRFLIDACAGTRLAQWLRANSHDVAESRERGPDPGDRILLQWAAEENRVLVTIDKDFGKFLFLQSAPHCGLIRLPDVPPGRRIALMDEILCRHGQDVLQGCVITIRGDRIRVSRTG